MDFKSHITEIYNVTCILFATQRLCKQIPTQANGLNNKTSIARQRGCKHASLTIEDGIFRGVSANKL
jgi:hypothetical protein